MKKFMVRLGTSLRIVHLILIISFISGTIGILFFNIQENFPTWYKIHMIGAIIFFLGQFVPFDGKRGRCFITVWEQRIWKQYDSSRYYTGGFWPNILEELVGISAPSWLGFVVGTIVSVPTLLLLPKFLNL